MTSGAISVNETRFRIFFATGSGVGEDDASGDMSVRSLSDFFFIIDLSGFATGSWSCDGEENSGLLKTARRSENWETSSIAPGKTSENLKEKRNG